MNEWFIINAEFIIYGNIFPTSEVFVTVPEYVHAEIENRWMDWWEKKGIYRTDTDLDLPKKYILVMFPYPSGPAHMGHVANYCLGDVFARYFRRNGYNVLHPMGFDAFGLPAENAAIARCAHPIDCTTENIDLITRDLKRLGYAYDWSREIATCDPDYYRWTQWFFLKLFERGLAYKADSQTNWCPSCQTVLANEQVLSDGTCERCSTVIQNRWLNQWFFRITDYAERLLDDMNSISKWPERVLAMQRNWIGRSTGATVRFTLESTGEEIEIYTTRPDTLFGATFFLLAPEHELVDRLSGEKPELQERVEEFRERVGKRTDFERTAIEAEKDGVFLEDYVINPVNGERLPVYVTNYVLIEYGTGAVMAVPAHDQRDFEFAKKYSIPIRPVVVPPEGPLTAELMPEAYEGPGTIENSGRFDGMSSEEAIPAVCDHLEENALGHSSVNYRLRDWLVSRQRFWGTPIPIVYCKRCGTVPVPEEELPVVLPVNLSLVEDGKSPLPFEESFYSTSCPKCGGGARRETDTMDTFVDSSWYFFRYLSPGDDARPFDPELARRWMPVDKYIGGIEHAILHLLYSRFFTKVIHDLGLIEFEEPFDELLCQGMITKDGAKMSKSKGNVVSPGELIERLGADSVRVYVLFMGPPELGKDWSDQGVEGIHRFIGRVWRMVHERYLPNRDDNGGHPESREDREMRALIHRTIENVTRDIEEFAFNTAISFIMELVNGVYHYTAEQGFDKGVLREAVEAVLGLLAPFAPFVSEELWFEIGHETSIHLSPWPEFDPEIAAPEELTIVVQVNGKVRAKLTVPVTTDEEALKRMAVDTDNARKYIGERPVRKVIVVPGKLVNIVV